MHAALRMELDLSATAAVRRVLRVSDRPIHRICRGNAYSTLLETISRPYSIRRRRIRPPRCLKITTIISQMKTDKLENKFLKTYRFFRRNLRLPTRALVLCTASNKPLRFSLHQEPT